MLEREPWREDFDAIIGLGSNLGDKARNVAQALDHLSKAGDVRIVRTSPLYRTAPWGKADQDWFVNACVAVSTQLSAPALLERCLEIEKKMKRVRTERWGPRIIDLDVLVYRDEVSSDPQLTLPHPRIMERAFVLVPLADIAPNLKIGGRSVAETLESIDRSCVVQLES